MSEKLTLEVSVPLVVPENLRAAVPPDSHQDGRGGKRLGQSSSAQACEGPHAGSEILLFESLRRGADPLQKLRAALECTALSITRSRKETISAQARNLHRIEHQQPRRGDILKQTEDTIGFCGRQMPTVRQHVIACSLECSLQLEDT